MFTELARLLKKGDTLVLTISREDDTDLRVNLVPKLFTLCGEQDPDRQALNQPLTLTGTPEELDSPEFTGTLNRFTASATQLRNTIDEVETAHQAAAKKKAETKPAKGAPAKAKAKPAKADDTEGDHDEDADDDKKPEAPAVPVKKTAETMSGSLI